MPQFSHHILRTSLILWVLQLWISCYKHLHAGACVDMFSSGFGGGGLKTEEHSYWILFNISVYYSPSFYWPLLFNTQTSLEDWSHDPGVTLSACTGRLPAAPTVWPMASDRWCEDMKAQLAVLAQLRPTSEVQFITRALLWDLAETGTIYLKLYPHFASTLSQPHSPSTLKVFS